MNSTLLETIATIVTALTALTALLAFFAGVSRNAVLRRQIDQLQSWRSSDTNEGRQVILDDLLATRRGQLLARQLTPLVATVGPPLGFLVLAAFGAQDGHSSIEYMVDTQTYSFAGWVETYYVDWFELAFYVLMLFLIYSPTPYISMRHTMIGRLQAVRDFKAGRPVRAPSGHFVWRDGPRAPRIGGRVWLAAYAAGLGAYLAGGSVAAVLSLQLLDGDASRDLVLGAAGVVAITATTSFMLLIFGAYFPFWADRQARELPARYPALALHLATRHWTPPRSK